MLRVFFSLLLLSCGIACASNENSNWDSNYEVSSLTSVGFKGKPTVVERVDPQQDPDACSIYLTPQTLQDYSFQELMDYLRSFGKKRPLVMGTGTVTNKGVLTVAHLLVEEREAALLRRKVFATRKPVAILQGITLNSEGKRVWKSRWVCDEKSSKSVSMNIATGFVKKRNFWGRITAVDWSVPELALISNTELRHVKATIADDIERYKNKRDLIEAECWHYPEDSSISPFLNKSLPQKQSGGHVGLNTICPRDTSAVHHDLAGYYGSSGAGIRACKLDEIIAVFCSGPACQGYFPHRKHNHCIPVDNGAIIKLDYDLAQEGKIMRFTGKFASLTSTLMMLWSSNVLASNYWKDAFTDENQGVFEYTGRTSSGLPKGTYTPSRPTPMWRRELFFTPSMRMIKVPLITSTTVASAYFFWARRHFNNAP